MREQESRGDTDETEVRQVKSLKRARRKTSVFIWAHTSFRGLDDLLYYYLPTAPLK